MTGAPLVSVVMANRNGARFLTEALQSLTAQTERDWELVFVDDASTDGSAELVQKIAAGDPRLRVVRQDIQRGPGAARNRALSIARGAWIAVFDSDDMMAPERLERLLKRASADRAAIVADNLMLFADPDSALGPLLPARFARSPRWVGLAEYINSGSLYARHADLGYLKPMIRSDAMRAAGARYDERLRIGEDYHFLGHLMAAGLGLRFDPAALYLYRKHSASLSHRMHAEDIRVLIEAEDRFARRLFRPSAKVCAALARRRTALRTHLLYVDAISAMKEGDSRRAVAIALSHPRIWPLLTRPLRARLKRLLDAAPSRAALPPVEGAASRAMFS